MQLSIQLFANLREHFQVDMLEVNLPDEATVGDLLTRLKDTYPEQRTLFNHVLVAKNQEFAGHDAPILDTDELALIPPVGGGEQIDSNTILISEQSLNIGDAYQCLESHNHGGTTMFVGTVREWTNRLQTSYLTYEAYESMALSQMHVIQQDVEAQYPGVKTLLWHRVGKLLPTDIAVICGASSPHRDASFSACRDLIERLKKEVTIWKKEYFSDGKSVWQANAESTKD